MWLEHLPSMYWALSVIPRHRPPTPSLDAGCVIVCLVVKCSVFVLSC